jgi:hypothetical protein
MTMQRKKSFVVVLAAIVFAVGARGQIPNRSAPLVFDLTGIPARTDGFMPGMERLAALPAAIALKRTMDLNMTTQCYPGTSSVDRQAKGRVGVVAVFGPAGWITGMALIHPLADDYYLRHLGIMCEKEWQLEKTTHIPLRLRLGSLQECNKMEGK